MSRLNSQETLWTVLPVVVVIILLIIGILFLPQAGTDVRSRASEPKPIITPNPSPTKPQAPEIVCSDLYSPVCGSDQKTYPNSCEANLAGITIFVDGACPTTTQKPAPKTPSAPSNELQFVLPQSN